MKIQMNKSWLIVFSLVALILVINDVAVGAAQEEPIAGGYAKTSVSDSEVISAARYAIRAQGRKQGKGISLISIRSAEVQVVAGLNYKLGLSVSINGKTQNVLAVVYKNLKQSYSLSSWEEVGNPTGRASAISQTTIKQLVEALAEAYTARDLGRLDAVRPYSGMLKIVIENSLGEDTDKDRFRIKVFRTLKQAEQWLQSRERDEMPAREARPLLQCKSGICNYDFEGGILHNHLYLQKISYAYKNGRPYIKTIYLLDGD